MNEAVKEFDRVIIGIDPGTNLMGYGILGVRNKKPVAIALGVIELSKFQSHYYRLGRIFERVTSLVETYLPDEMAIEAPFFGKNVQSMLKLGRAQGVAMAAAISRDVPIAEYEPRKIKQAITGSGAASKEQVREMLRRILNIPEENLPPQARLNRRHGRRPLPFLRDHPSPPHQKAPAPGKTSSPRTPTASANPILSTKKK